MLLTCTKCKEVKESLLFHRYDKKKNGFTSQCKQCRNETRKNSYWKDSERAKEKTRNYRKNLRETDPHKLFLSNRKTNLKQTYGISLEEYDKMLQEQSSKCDVCGKEHEEVPKKRLGVDHCHTTGKVRGLLCANCNTALGLLKENVQNIDKLKDYIIKHQKI